MKILIIALVLLLLGTASLWLARNAVPNSGPLEIKVVGQVATSSISKLEYLEGRNWFYELNTNLEPTPSESDLLLEARNTGNGVLDVLAFSTNFWWPRIERLQSNQWVLIETRWAFGNPRVSLYPGEKMMIGCPALLGNEWRVSFNYTETRPESFYDEIRQFSRRYGVRSTGRIEPEERHHRVFVNAPTNLASIETSVDLHP